MCARRNGYTLIELLAAICVTGVLLLSLGGIASAVRAMSDHYEKAQGLGTPLDLVARITADVHRADRIAASKGNGFTLRAGEETIRWAAVGDRIERRSAGTVRSFHVKGGARFRVQGPPRPGLDIVFPECRLRAFCSPKGAIR